MADAAALTAPITFDSLLRTQFAPARAAALAARAVHPVALRVGTATVAVRFSHSQSAAAFAARYLDLKSDTAPDFTLFAVEEGGDVFFWADAARRVWHWNDGALHAEAVAFFADSAAIYEFLCASPLAGFHSAVLARAEAAGALIGETTAGKTTTAVACVRRGMRLYSDERCILEDGRVVPFLRRMTLRSGGRAALLADPHAEPLGIDGRLRDWQQRDEVAVRASALFGAAAGGPPLPLAAVFVIEGRSASPEVVPTQASAVMRLLLASMASRESGLDRVARVLHELRETRVYRLRLGPPDATACAIAATLGEAVAR